MPEHYIREKEMPLLKMDHNVKFFFASEATSGFLSIDGLMAAQLYHTVGKLSFFSIFLLLLCIFANDVLLYKVLLHRGSF